MFGKLILCTKINRCFVKIRSQWICVDGNFGIRQDVVTIATFKFELENLLIIPIHTWLTIRCIYNFLNYYINS